MKKYLLPKDGSFYKANLHCHSTCSDGKLTPEQIKSIYMEHGYSIVAFTDHDVLIPHSDLREENFLPLNGYEMEVNEFKYGDFSLMKTCHMCFIALEPDNLTQVCWHRSKYLFANSVSYRDSVVFDDKLPDFERVYSHECISRMMKAGREGGFFVTYNHPVWSSEEQSDFLGYNGMHAMEICNYSCQVGGFNDYNDVAYDAMLRSGKHIYCVATDDNHNAFSDERSDSFGGFTMIKADNLEYTLITNALLRGNFYASQGPLIHELWYEDGKIGVKCSAAYSIILSTGRRRTECRYSKEGTLTEALFDVLTEDNYVRITIADAFGRRANTNAYFVDELNKG